MTDALGEMDRWDTIRLREPDWHRFVEAMDAVTDLLNSVQPSVHNAPLALANGLLRQVMDSLPQVKTHRRQIIPCHDGHGPFGPIDAPEHPGANRIPTGLQFSSEAGRFKRLLIGLRGQTA